jgi:hypothetical protein
MWLRLRQIALVAHDLDTAVSALTTTLGIAVCYNDPGVGLFGLHNALLPVGNQFLEVVAPLPDRPDPAATAGGRYLQRRGGDGGYMVITQCDDHGPRRARIESLGVRLAHSFEVPGEFRNLQLHPKDTGGTFFEIDEQLGTGAHRIDGPWEPAGREWKRGQRLERVRGIAAAEVQCDDPGKVAARWGEIAELTPAPGPDGHLQLTLDNATVRFVPCADGRPEGLGGIDVLTVDREAVLAGAAACGAPVDGDVVHLVGMRVKLVDTPE